SSSFGSLFPRRCFGSLFGSPFGSPFGSLFWFVVLVLAICVVCRRSQICRYPLMVPPMKFPTTVLALVLATAANAQVNAGTQAPEASLPFTMTRVAQFNLPWRIAFFPDGKMLVTEKPGALWLVTPEGTKTKVANVPAVLLSNQGGMLGVY